ncbi:syntaxin-binding protein 5 isoform X4 [Atheta coriaria]|uniref:syntaxin-binding protein 5 isoform X4 n=1 Tax=Dalotia coriaria TaxID=877792 RepID=UPI0031F3943D
MKKFTIRSVLDTFRTSVTQPTRTDQEVVQETLRQDNFQVKRTFRHGFPFQPTAVAYDPIQKLLAIGSKCGSLRIFGQAGVDVHVRHDMEGPPGSVAVMQIVFLVNEGALITATAENTMHLWNFRQKIPQVVQSLKFQKERITCMHLPLQSKWLYVGTERGNIHIVHIESFQLSGYIINWNKVIEYSRKTHPGPVVHLSDNPLDASKLLIGYESGQVVLWDMRSKVAEMRIQTADPVRSIAWHYEGKQFMCSHNDGSLTTWAVKTLNNKEIHMSRPHAKVGKDAKIEQCKPIPKVEWKSSKTGEAFVIFSGGMPYDQSGRTPSITVVHSKTTTVLEMEHPVIDFITLCESPYTSDLQEPYAIVVLLQNDLVVMDLQTAGFPCLENPYPMDIHESPVTCCNYLADCPADLIPAFYSVGRAGAAKRQGFSEMDWPICGGKWASPSCSYSEIIMTGHADGSVKFWDASAGTLQVLYKLKSAKVFEKPNKRSLDSDEEPFAVQLISLCPESRKLAVAGASSYVILFTYNKKDANDDVTVLEIPIVYENPDEGACSPDMQIDLCDSDNKKELKVRTGNQKKPAGFQAQLVCITPWSNGEPPSHIAALTINSSYGLMAYGNDAGMVIIDIEQKVCLLNIGSPDLYGAQDPYSRAPRSPKRGGNGDTLPIDRDDRHPRSPSIDQINGVCSPASGGGCQSGGGGGSIGSGGMGGQLGGGGGTRSRPDPPRRSRSQDKLDSSFSRSRSSSMSSLENITSEAIQCLAFADTYAKRNDHSYLSPTLWVGTSLGSVLTVLISPPDPDSRSSQPVVVSLVGVTIFRLKGAIRMLSFLDASGDLIPSSYEKSRSRPSSASRNSNRMSPTLGENNRENCDKQYLVIVSEKQARVVGLPSQICNYRQQIADSDFVVKAETVTMRDSVCLLCYVSTGHLQVYSLPSLRPLIDVDFLPLSELSFQTQSKKGIVDPMLSIWGQQLIVNEDTNQISRTFCFSNRGHGLYLCSPSELQKYTVDAEFCNTIGEMVGELFLVIDMPEPPKESFFKGLFGGGVRPLDREELFGENSGKAAKHVAKHIPGALAEMNQQVNRSTNEISNAHRLMVERGQKLGQLEDSAERMANEAQAFSSGAHELMLKYKEKKWYQL